MKRLIVLTTVMLFGASLAFGQAGVLGTYEDMEGLDCDVVDVPGLLSIFVVHTLTAGATAAQYKATTPLCMSTNGTTFFGDQAVFGVTLGSSQTGVAIGYGVCLSSPIHNLTIAFFAGGNTSLCCAYIVDGDPLSDSGLIEIVDCQGGLLIGTGRTNTVNGEPAICPCTTPVEETTWGAVKALYGE
jgi:hypothetical protein